VEQTPEFGANMIGQNLGVPYFGTNMIGENPHVGGFKEVTRFTSIS
jgi:hypothetical protein